MDKPQMALVMALLFTLGVVRSFAVSTDGSVAASSETGAAASAGPACKLVYTHQMEPLAGGEEWQAWDVTAIATYHRLHGQQIPGQPPLNPKDKCYRQVVDARKAGLCASASHYEWSNNLCQKYAFQGCAVYTEDRHFYAQEMANLTILLPQMWVGLWSI